MLWKEVRECSFEELACGTFFKYSHVEDILSVYFKSPAGFVFYISRIITYVPKISPKTLVKELAPVAQ